MYLEQKLAGLLRCLNCGIFSRTEKGELKGPNQSRAAHYSTLSRLEYPEDHRRNYQKNKSTICYALWRLPERCPKFVGHRSQKITFDLKCTRKYDTGLSWMGGKVEDPRSFQSTFATLSGIFKGFLLGRYHFKILLRSCLY